MRSLDDCFKSLLREEHLDDFDRLLFPREWDEVPLVSRYSRMKFLNGFDIEKRCCILTKYAVLHLDRILRFVIDNDRRVFVMVSVTNWEDLRAAEPDPVMPCFWISTDPGRDLGGFHTKPGSGDEAQSVSKWLKSSNLLETHEVLESITPSDDEILRRVYIRHKSMNRRWNP